MDRRVNERIDQGVEEFLQAFHYLVFDQHERGQLHNNLRETDWMYELICRADDAAFAELEDYPPVDLSGDVNYRPEDRDQVKDARYIFVCYVAVMTYRLIRDQVLDSETAYTVSDIALQRIDRAQTTSEISEEAYIYTKALMKCVAQARHEQKEYHYLVDQAKEYIFQHLHTKITEREMAEALGTTASYLSRVFHQKEGMTIQKYILQERLSRAQNMLRFSDFAIGEISSYLGFASQSHFGKAFREAYGMTPGVYRRSAKKTDK